MAASNAAAFTAALRGTNDDALLGMSQAQALDRDALDRLIATAQGAALRYGMLVCGNVADAEDAMQDALLQVYRYAGDLRNPNAFRTWLYRTVKNACLRDLEGLSTQQVAAVAGITQDNVKQRLHRARAMLRKALLQPGRS